MKKVIILYLALFNGSVSSAPYNEKDAFCRDKIYGYTSNYTKAKIYNDCMRNADKLIYKYEQEQRRRRIEWERGEPERRRQRELREKEQKQQELEAKKREQQRKEEEYRKRLEKEKEQKRIDNLFETKFD